MLIKSLRKKFLFGIYKLFPIEKNTVVFKSFEGQYNDNPKYISQKLHELRPDIKIVWGITNKSSKQDIPDYITTLDINSRQFSKIAATAVAAVENMSGMQGIKGKRYFKPFDYFIKRKKQLNISTWHGTPLKKIGCDIANYNASYYQTSAAYMTAGNQFSFDVFEKAFRGVKIRLYGTARNDILLAKNVDRHAVKEKLKLPADKKVLLYAPTFRQSAQDSGIKQITEFDLNKMFGVLSEKFGGDWIIVLRVHHTVILKLKEECDGLVDHVRVFDGNMFDDMAEYLLCADVLLTDYSSCMFDYMLTGKPCFLYAHDRDNYVNDERGVYMDIKELPYLFADSSEELYENIRAYDKEDSNQKEKRFLDKIGNFEDGHASERVVKDILSFMDKENG